MQHRFSLRNPGLDLHANITMDEVGARQLTWKTFIAFGTVGKIYDSIEPHQAQMLIVPFSLGNVYDCGKIVS